MCLKQEAAGCAGKILAGASRFKAPVMASALFFSWIILWGLTTSENTLTSSPP